MNMDYKVAMALTHLAHYYLFCCFDWPFQLLILFQNQCRLSLGLICYRYIFTKIIFTCYLCLVVLILQNLVYQYVKSKKAGTHRALLKLVKAFELISPLL